MQLCSSNPESGPRVATTENMEVTLTWAIFYTYNGIFCTLLFITSSPILAAFTWLLVSICPTASNLTTLNIAFVDPWIYNILSMLFCLHEQCIFSFIIALNISLLSWNFTSFCYCCFALLKERAVSMDQFIKPVSLARCGPLGKASILYLQAFLCNKEP